MREIHAAFDLLDRQVLDNEGEPVGKVDDLEIARHAGMAHVVAVLMGPQALGGRLGGHVGRWIGGLGRRLSKEPDPVRVPIELIEDLGVVVRLKVRADRLPREGDAEEWFRERFIARIPGSEHGSE